MSSTYLISLFAALCGLAVAYFAIHTDRNEQIVLAAVIASTALAVFSS